MPNCVDENIVLAGILKFKEFNNFYKKERPKIPYDIKWIKDNNFEKSYVAFANSIKHEILFRDMPRSKADAYVIAHEVLHLIRNVEMAPLSIKYYNGNEKLATVLSGLLEDPIVDLILKNEYKFNFRSRCLNEVREARKNTREESSNTLECIIEGFIFANWILRWDLIDDKKAMKEWNRYLKRFQAKCPKTYIIGYDVTEIINENGLDTKEKQKTVVNTLINKFELHDKILYSED